MQEAIFMCAGMCVHACVCVQICKVENYHMYCNNVVGLIWMAAKSKKMKEFKVKKFQHEIVCLSWLPQVWMIKACKKATSVKGGTGSCESCTSLNTLSAGILKSSPLLIQYLYLHHMNCKMMRQGIAPAIFSPSSFIKNLETAHLLSVTWWGFITSILRCVHIHFFCSVKQFMSTF